MAIRSEATFRQPTLDAFAVPLLRCILLVITILGIVHPVLAQQPQSAEAPPPVPSATYEQTTTAAPVIVDGHVLFSVRGVSAYPAKERARNISKQINDLAQDESTPPEALVLRPIDGGVQIVAKKHRIMTVVQADAELEGLADTSILATVYRARIVDAVASYRQERTPEALLKKTLFAVVATLVFILAIWLVRWAFRKIRAGLETRYKKRIKDIELRTFRILDAEQLWAGFHGAIRVLRIISLIAVAYMYVEFVLSLYPWTRQLANRLSDWVLGPVSTIALGFIRAIPDLIFIAIIIFITRYVLKLAKLFFDAAAKERIHLANFDPDWSWPTYRILRVVFIAFAAVMAYPYIPGSDSAAFKGISIFLGVIVSLGSSSAIANMIAGYSMTYRRAFREGDRIKVDTFIGDVEEMRLLVTHLRSLKNEEIVVPNSIILNSNVINYTTLAAERGLILHTTVSIGYEVPWRQVEAMLLMAAERTLGLMKEPEPFVLQKELADFAVTYELNVYCDRPKLMIPLYTELHKNVLDVFNEYEVQIMTPSYEHDPEEPKLVPKSRWFEAPAKMRDEEGPGKS